jgi:hypothetical protein
LKFYKGTLILFAKQMDIKRTEESTELKNQDTPDKVYGSSNPPAPQPRTYNVLLFRNILLFSIYIHVVIIY